MKKGFVILLVVLGCALLIAQSPPIRSWSVGETFAFKEQCLYSGSIYECVQAHTVYDPAWTPPNTPALWKYIGPSASSTVPPPSDTHWHKVPGEAVDIGIGAYQIYILGPWDYYSSEQEVGLIWRWNWSYNGWEFFPDNQQARSINVDWQGNPYIVSMEGYHQGTINRYQKGKWEIDPVWWNHDPDFPLYFCPAFDIGISEADNSTHCNYYSVARFPWIGNIAFHYCPTVKHWDTSSSSGPPFRMDAGPQGYPVAIFSGGQVYRMVSKDCHGEKWELLAGQSATDVAWGTSGVWIVGTEGGSRGGYLYRWDGKAWVRYSNFYAYKLDVGNKITLPWVITKSHNIYRLDKN